MEEFGRCATEEELGPTRPVDFRLERLAILGNRRFYQRPGLRYELKDFP